MVSNLLMILGIGKDTFPVANAGMLHHWKMKKKYFVFRRDPEKMKVSDSQMTDMFCSEIFSGDIVNDMMIRKLHEKPLK